MTAGTAARRKQTIAFLTEKKAGHKRLRVFS
jgi:hypothetical protein